MISRRTLTLATVGALVAAGLAAVPTTANAASATRHPTHRPHLDRTGPPARPGGRLPAPASFRVYLAPRGGLAALKQDVAALSDPASASYRHFLTAAQYHAKYDAPASAVSAVSSWLTGSHLRVTSVEPHRRYLSATGSVAAVQRALGVSLSRYRHDGHTVRANDQAVSVPAALAPYVATVTGLDTTPRKVRHHAQKSGAVPRGLPQRQAVLDELRGHPRRDQGRRQDPAAEVRGQDAPVRRVRLHRSAAAQGLRGRQRPHREGGHGGDHRRLRVTDHRHRRRHLREEARRRRLRLRAADPGHAPALHPAEHLRLHRLVGEETLDVEAVHAMAPDAKIRYYASASCFDDDFLAALAQVVDDDDASLVTNSWSDLEVNETPDVTAAYEQIFLQGAEQGIGFLFSSGDDGDEAVNGLGFQADYPASDPYATAVGGTADAIDASGFAFQTGWGTHKWSLSADGSSWTDLGYLYGAGGGLSSQFARPGYQDGVVPDRYGTPGPFPTSVSTPTRRPACWSGRPSGSATGTSTTSTASAAPVWPRRCSPA